MNNDISSNLRSLRAWNRGSLVSRMLSIQAHKEHKESEWNWRNDLRFLTPVQGEDRLLKYAFPGKHGRIEYTALSYPWTSSLYEEAATYTWHIKTDDSVRRADVRDAVLDRVSKFMTHFEIEYLWIDLECIDQQDEEERRRIMGKMHHVYATSFHPLALLFVPIRTRTELDLLMRLMKGELIEMARRRKRGDDESYESDVYLLTSDIVPDEAYIILDLIHRLLSDDWWSRAWCFQEEYVSMRRMTLLLPTLIDVRSRQDEEFISFMDGEVAIGARDFRYAVTRFVFAYIATVGRRGASWILDKGICRHILEKAGWYTLISVHGHTLDLDSEGKALTTQILADIRGKKYTVPSDLIHISTNCNFYPLSLNTRRLNEENESLAMSILTLFFLNGEIFRNGLEDEPSPQQAADLNAFDYLKRITFDEFPANGEPGQLAWLRKYRFVSPLLTLNGIRTVGHVWQIDQTLRLPAKTWSSIRSSLSSETDSVSDIHADEQTMQILSAIRDNLPDSCGVLRGAITGFLKHKFDLYWQDDRSSDADALSVTAADLAAAIRDGQLIGLGHIVDADTRTNSGSVKFGLFAIERKVTQEKPIHAFTAWKVRTNRNQRHHRRYGEDKCISLRVSIDEQQNDIPTLCLRTKARIHSLSFCAGIKHTSVTFPWPRSLPG